MKFSLLLRMAAGALACAVLVSPAFAATLTVSFGPSELPIVENFTGLPDGVSTPHYSNYFDVDYVGVNGGVYSNMLGTDKSWMPVSGDYSVSPFAQGYTTFQNPASETASDSGSQWFTEFSVMAGQRVSEPGGLDVDLYYRVHLEGGDMVVGRIGSLPYLSLTNVNFSLSSGYMNQVDLCAGFHFYGPGFACGGNQWDTSILDQAARNNTIHPPTDPGAVPEPATWALMILGFGAIGSMVRAERTRRLAFARI